MLSIGISPLFPGPLGLVAGADPSRPTNILILFLCSVHLPGSSQTCTSKIVGTDPSRSITESYAYPWIRGTNVPLS